ncbi:lys-63-specific deubiquitinase BRCC36-like protein [Mucor lusitanicus]
MLNQVVLPAYIYHLILTHAYSTENEEIIGMLIGYWETLPSNNPYQKTKSIAHVKYISFLTRSDKRKDRVEIAPESLHLAALEAEVSCCVNVGSLLCDVDCIIQEFGKKTGKPMMVIGWYHSHPHITVFPSHVVFGIIASCFDSHNDNTEKLQITCFQSAQDNQRLNIPLLIEPSLDMSSDIRELLLKLPEHMYEEYKKEFAASNECIKYDLRSIKNIDTSSLPNTMTQLYNAGVYGQLLTSLVDNMIVPTTHILDLRAMELTNEIEELKKFKQALSLSTSNVQLILNNEEALKFKTKAQLLYGASKIMRQQSYFLYDDSAKLWSKLKTDLLNPAVSSFIDMDKTTIPKQFDFAFNDQINFHPDADNSSVIVRVETSRNTGGMESLNLLGSSVFPHLLNDPLLQQHQQQQNQGDPQQQEYQYDDIDIGDMGYDMMDYDFDEQQSQHDISAIINEPPAGNPEAQDDSIFDFPLVTADMQMRQHSHYTSPLGAPAHIAASAATYQGLGPIRNASGPPSLIQEEDEEEQDNLSITSISTSHLSTILPIEAITQGQAARFRAKHMKRMVVENTMLSYATDYTTDAIVVRTPIQQIHVANVRRETDSQRLARIRLNLRYPSIVFNATYHKDALSTEKGIEQSRRYDHYRVRNTGGSTSSQLNAFGIRRLSHQAPSSGGVSVRSHSDVHNTPEMHNLDLDGDMELERVQEENTSIWQQQQQFQPADDDVMDYGGGDIDFGESIEVSLSAIDDLLQQQQQQQQQTNQEEEMHRFMEHIRQLPNPFYFQSRFASLRVQFGFYLGTPLKNAYFQKLELASKSQIRVSQTEPYAPIEVHYLF